MLPPVMTAILSKKTRLGLQASENQSSWEMMMSHNSKTMLFSKRGHFQPSSWNSQPTTYVCLPKHVAAWRWRFWRHPQNRVVFAWFAKSLKEATETPEMFILSSSIGSHPRTYTRKKDFTRPSGRKHGYTPLFQSSPLRKGDISTPGSSFRVSQRCRSQICSGPVEQGKKTYPILPSPRFSSAPWKLLNM